LYALALSTLIAFPAGIWAAARRGQPGDLAVMGATQLGVAIPNFWFAMLMVLVFAINLRWFPAGGFVGWDKGLSAGLHSLTLPAIALALPQAAILTRVMRSALIDALSEDYIRTARAKGLTRGQALRRHALRNAMIPVLTIIGMQFSFLLAGAIIIENVFYLPGLGRLIFQAISARDLIVVESVVMILVFAVIMVNFAVDLAYAAVDPRLRARE
jgi:peptide/nickel transport system permease protein